MDLDEIIWNVKEDSIKKLVESGKRPDGRKPDEYRKIELTSGYAEKAEGSCFIKLGDTQVLVGVKLALGEPYPDSPDRGVLVTNTELSPMAAPVFQSGPPREPSIEISRVVDRGLRESGMIDVERLCITPGEKVWTVLVDIHAIDYDGNLIDAASIAAVKALWDTKMPKIEDDRIIRDEFKGKLPVELKPVSATFAKLDSHNLLDPALAEEKVMDSRLTIVTQDKGEICAMQKEGGGSYTEKEIYELVDIAAEKAKDIRKLY